MAEDRGKKTARAKKTASSRKAGKVPQTGCEYCSLIVREAERKPLVFGHDNGT